jgi:P27 family predicted phage terminase small subunit
VNTLPRPPKYLSAPARRLWRETVESYELARHHLELLERACRALDQAIEAEELLRRDGLVVDGRYGVRAHPAVAIARDARIAFARLLREIDPEGVVAPDARTPRRT